MRERLGEPDDGELRRRIARGERAAGLARDGRDVHDGPPPRARSSGSAAWVTRTTPFTLTAIMRSNCASDSCSNGPPDQDAGVVHDDVEPAQAGDGLLDDPAGVGGLGDVADDPERADATALDAPNGGLEIGRLREAVSDGAVVRRSEVGGGDVDALLARARAIPRPMPRAAPVTRATFPARFMSPQYHRSAALVKVAEGPLSDGRQSPRTRRRRSRRSSGTSTTTISSEIRARAPRWPAAGPPRSSPR